MSNNSPEQPDWSSGVANPESFTYLTELSKRVQYLKDFLKLLDLQPKQNILEVGCGIGSHALVYANQIPQGSYHGIDISSEAIKQAQIALPPDLVPKNTQVSFTVQDITLPPEQIKLGLYDRVFTERVLQHFGDSSLNVLNNMINHTQPGGLIGFAEPDWSSLEFSHPDQDTTKLILKQASRRSFISRPIIASQLPDILDFLGMIDIQFQAHSDEIVDQELAQKIFNLPLLLNLAQNCHDITSQQIQSWLAQIPHDNFSARLNVYLVTAKKL